MDDFSRAVAGYYLAFDPPSSLRTCLALRQAIWRKQDPHWQVCGIPDVLYTDNGSDFTSKRLEQVTRDMGEIRIFHKNRFLCRAISAELAGEEVPLRELVRARTQRGRELRASSRIAGRLSTHFWISGEDRRCQLFTRRVMEAAPFPRHPVPESSGTATSEPARFVETLEHSRFIEFCEVCKQYRYIGLCFGAPGIGKTLSAVRYSQADAIGQLDHGRPSSQLGSSTRCSTRPPL